MTRDPMPFIIWCVAFAACIAFQMYFAPGP